MHDIDRLREVFDTARKLATDQQREEYLRIKCDGDRVFRGRVNALLLADREAGSFLQDDEEEEDDLACSNGSDRIGSLIGPYKIREQLAEGGMGVVYVAEQLRPMQRKVALKIIKPGLATKEVLARFEAERQALALMNHPNIAAVLDGGATDDGQPYFVMELVRGIPITEYCDLQRLTTGQRLRLFLDVCQAVQHSHRMGIIHRDIKPTNVLVGELDGAAVVKVIDFGVAKALNQRLTEQTVYTQFSQLVGTPTYMSPEQASVNLADIDTRTDVYSLGVLLYELLTGSTPFDRETLKQAGFDELRRIIREDEPQKPSAAVSTLRAEAISTVAARRHIDPRRLCDSLKGELDWIVLKALEKDRTRRYESASAFAADVQRYLDDEPVLACPPSTAYRLAKYARRHKAQLATVVTVALVMLAATIVSAILATWAVREQRIARRNEQVANRQRTAAVDARANAEQQEQLAKQQRDAAEYDSYIANIQLANRNLVIGDALFKPLAAAAPKPGRPDYRGWEWYYLYSQAHHQRHEFPFQWVNGRKSKDRVVAWSPDGKLLATVDKTGLVNVWDVGTGQLKTSLREVSAGITSLAWSASGRSLAAGTNRKFVAIWDVPSMKMVRSLRGYCADQVEWHPDSVRLALGGEDGVLRIWHTQTGKQESPLFLDASLVRSLDWHPNGVHLAASSKDVTKVFDTSTATEVMAQGVTTGGWVRFSPDGSRLFYARRMALSLVEFPSLRLVWSFPAYTASLTWSPDGDQAAASVNTRTVNLWDAGTGQMRASMPFDHAARVIWSPSGHLLATASAGKVKLWDTTGLGNRDVTFSVGGSALSLAFSPNGQRILVGADHRLEKRDTETNSKLFSEKTNLRQYAVEFGPEGKRFAALSRGGVSIRDAETGKAVLPLLKSEDSPRSLAWNADGKRIAVGYQVRRVGESFGHFKIFDTRTAELIVASPIYPRTGFGGCQVAWSPDGCRLAVAVARSVRVWGADLREEKVLPVPGVLSAEVVWSPCGRFLASARPDSVWIYDVASATPVHVLESATQVMTVAWHPKMPRLASGGQDGRVRLWDTVTGREVCTLDAPGDDQWVYDIAWSADGLRLASASMDGMVRIWDGSLAPDYLQRHGDLRDRAARLVQQEEFKGALEILEQLRSHHPRDESLEMQIQRVTWLHATQLAANGQTAAALEIFGALRDASAIVPDFRLHVPGKMFAAQKYQAAIELAEEYVEEFPHRREYRDELAFLYESRVTEFCRAGEFDEAASILRKLVERFTDRPDFRGQLLFELAKVDRFDETLQTLEELADAFAAWPDYRPSLARRLTTVSEHELATKIYDRLLRDNPDAQEYQILRTVSSVRALTTDLDDGMDTLRGLGLDKLDGTARDALAIAYLNRAESHFGEDAVDAAVANLSRAFELPMSRRKGYVGYSLALAQLASGGVEAYRHTCSRMVAELGMSSDPEIAFWVAWSCVLAPASVADYSAPIAAAQLALDSDRESVSYLATLGAILMRAGRCEAAVEPLTQASARAESSNQTSPAYTSYFLAMTRYQLGQIALAAEWLNKANQYAAQELSTNQPEQDVAWNRRLTLEMLRLEAESLLANELKRQPNPTSRQDGG